MKTDKVIDGVLITATEPEKGEPYIWPDGVTEIGSWSFSNWESFNQSFSIPESVTKIGECAFARWNSFNQPCSIPESVTEIGECAFYCWTSFNQPFSIPEGVTEIGEYAFDSWNSFNQPFSIPEGVTKIGECAFYRWNSFNQPFSIPESVTKIGGYAFYNWTSFNQPFSIPKSVTEIGSWAFYGWTSFNQPNSRKAQATNEWLRIDNWVFAGCYTGTLEQLRKRLDSGKSTPKREDAWKIISKHSDEFDEKTMTQNNRLTKDGILCLLKKGWECGVSDHGLVRRAWAQERLCKGGQTYKIHMGTLNSLVKKNILVRLSALKTDAFWLTRYGLSQLSSH